MNKTIKYGLGLTTYREDRKENLCKRAFDYAGKNQNYKAASVITKTIDKKLSLKGIKHYTSYPALGIYEGGSEPSTHIYFETDENGITKEMLDTLRDFRKLSNQDSLLLYRYIEKGERGTVGIEITHDKGVIQNMQEAILEATDGNIGGYLTYIYGLKKIVIINVLEFDGLGVKEFKAYIPKIRKAITGYGKVSRIINVRPIVIKET